MQSDLSLERERQNYCETLYPCADEATRNELHRTFFAGALVLEMLVVRVASRKGLLTASEGPLEAFLDALAPLRDELHGVAEELAEEPENGKQSGVGPERLMLSTKGVCRSTRASGEGGRDP